MDLKRQYKVCMFGLMAEIHYSLKRRGNISVKGEDRLVAVEKWRDPPGPSREGGKTYWSLKIHASSSCVFSGRWTTSQKGFPHQKKDNCELFLSDCIPNTHNCHRRRKKNIMIFLYIYATFRSLSSCSLYDTHS